MSELDAVALQVEFLQIVEIEFYPDLDLRFAL
jgi:hypothetical protein